MKNSIQTLDITQHSKKSSMDKLIKTLSASSLFREFNKDELTEISLRLVHQQSLHGKGSIIYMEQDLCTSMDIILSGTVIIQQIDTLGNILSIVEFNKGDTIAGNILFNKKNLYPMTISALQDTTLLHLSKEIILDFCKNPKFTEALLSDISQRAVILTHTIKNITRKSLRQKIIDYLIYLHISQKENPLLLPSSKTNLAQSFGVARPSLSREFTEMKKDGLLSYERNSVLLSDSFIRQYIHQ